MEICVVDHEKHFQTRKSPSEKKGFLALLIHVQVNDLENDCGRFFH